MEKPQYERIYNLHSWSGFVFGFLLFAIAVSGSFALFIDELQTWETPELRDAQIENLAPIDDALTAWVNSEVDDIARVEFVRLYYPSPIMPYYEGLIYIDQGDHVIEKKYEKWNAETGKPLIDRGAGLTAWLYHFHRELVWPNSLGGYVIGGTLVGIVGLVFFILIVTGILIHKKILKELFTLRFYTSMFIRWQNTHKIFGIWGMPFYGMISFTGALMGLSLILLPIIAILTFQGDESALKDAIFGEIEERTGVAAQMISVDELSALQDPGSGFPVRSVTMYNWGDETAHFNVFFDPDTELGRVDPDIEFPQFDAYQIDGVTGARIEDSFVEQLTPAAQVLNAVPALHYATYGGALLKLVYFLLGISLAVMTALGMMIWVERRLHGSIGARSKTFYQRASHLIAGFCAGLPLAFLSLFYSERLIAGGLDGRLNIMGGVFFAVWGSAIVFAFVRANDYRTIRELLFAVSGAAVGIPILNGITTGDFFLPAIAGSNAAAAWVDMLFVIGGAGMAWVVLKLPSERPGRKRKPSPA